MATYTPNLNLIKPAGTDYVRVSDFNENANVLDASIGDLGQLQTTEKTNLVLAINEAKQQGEHLPYIDETTKTWWVWNASLNQYEDSEESAKGVPGVSVTVGTTTTGAAGTQASVSNSGTESDAVLNFTIPQGATGAGVPDGGTDGQIIVKSGVSAVWQDQNSVSYDTQTGKTDAQKAQARTNIGAASNANLFINWDWRNPVNQRAATTWSMHSLGIDHWRFQSVLDDGGMTVNSGYVTVSAGSYNEGAYTRVEQNIIETGKTYTVSLLLHDGSVLSAQVVAPAKDGTFVPSSFGSASWNCGIMFNNGAWSVYLAQWLGNASASLDIDAVKLELGSVSTLLSDAPPDYAEELLKCQRYYQLRSLGDIAASDMRPMMRLANPTVTSVANGYAYSADL